MSSSAPGPGPTSPVPVPVNVARPSDSLPDSDTTVDDAVPCHSSTKRRSIDPASYLAIRLGHGRVGNQASKPDVAMQVLAGWQDFESGQTSRLGATAVSFLLARRGRSELLQGPLGPSGLGWNPANERPSASPAWPAEAPEPIAQPGRHVSHRSRRPIVGQGNMGLVLESGPFMPFPHAPALVPSPGGLDGPTGTDLLSASLRRWRPLSTSICCLIRGRRDRAAQKGKAFCSPLGRPRARLLPSGKPHHKKGAAPVTSRSGRVFHITPLTILCLPRRPDPN